ncbi:50S ribosomal protein L18e [Nanoarchaeota archaeon]
MVSQTKIKDRVRKKENPEMKEVVSALRKKSAFWQEVATLLVKPKKRSIKVNLGKLDKETKAGEVVIVPGKILSSGELSHKLTLGAFSFSEKALEKMKAVKVMSLDKMADSYKDGKGVKLIV